MHILLEGKKVNVCLFQNGHLLFAKNKKNISLYLSASSPLSQAIMILVFLYQQVEEGHEKF